MSNIYDIVVAGGGIAGLAAGMVAAQLGRKTLVLTGDLLGGQLLSIEKVEGFPGHPDGIPGYDLLPMAQEQAGAAGAEFAATTLQSLARDSDGWRLVTGDGELSARAVIAATGASLKSLGVPGESRLTGKGVSHCATCDGPLLRNRAVAVIGGGDSAMQEALTLAQFAGLVIILNRGAAMTGQATYRQRVAAQGNIELRHNTAVEDILGDTAVTGLRLITGGNTIDLPVEAVFVYIGLEPNSAFLGNLTALDPSGRIVTDAGMRTDVPGLCAAGAVRSGSAGRAVASAGDGASAALAADRYLSDGTWRA
ncbi:MAG: NAD(P)/FAD-dependent oxidoreductase [Xanthobacteraceae bacterium]